MVLKPVTHVAEFAVKYASRKFVYVPFAEDIGRHKRTAPRVITAKKLSAITRVARNLNIVFSVKYHITTAVLYQA